MTRTASCKVIPAAPAPDRWVRGATRGPRALIGGVADRRRGDDGGDHATGAGRGGPAAGGGAGGVGGGRPGAGAGPLPDARAARRMLALALVLEGASREEAARAAGMDRQTL